MDCYLLQDSNEVEHALVALKRSQNRQMVVAWSSSAIDALQKHSIKYICAGDIQIESFNYFARRELLEWYGELLFELDRLFEGCETCFGIEPKLFVNASSSFRNNVMMYVLETDLISDLIARYDVSNIIYYEYEEPEFSPLSLVLSEIDFGIFLSKKIPEWNMSKSETREHIAKTYIPQNNAIHKGIVNSFINRLKRSLKSIKNKEYPFSLLSWFSGLTFGKFIDYSRTKNILIYSDTSIETRLQLKSLLGRRDNIRLFFYDELVWPDRKKFVCDFELTDSDLEKVDREKFFYKDVDLFPLIEHSVRDFVRENLSGLQSNYALFLDLLENVPINLVLSSYYTPVLDRINDVCEKKEIPVVYPHHGGTVGYMKGAPFSIDYFRSGMGNVYCEVYTNQISRHIANEMCGISASRINYCVTGSYYYKSLYEKRSQGELKAVNNLRICFVLGMFVKVADNNFGILRESCMYEFMRDVIDYFKKDIQIELFVKSGYGAEHYDLEVFSEQENVTVIGSSVMLQTVMDDMDLFILPSVSSPLFELVCTNKRIVLLYDKRSYSIDEVALKKLEKRVDVFYSGNDLLVGLKGIVDELILKKNYNVDDSFFNSYCWDGKIDPVEEGANLLDNLL